MVCDSNILIYAAEPGDVLCQPYLQKPEAMISCVTRIEVLGFPRFHLLSSAHQAKLRALVASTTELALDEDVILRAILLRQQQKMSLADAIIAATALEYNVPLVTRNTADFTNLAGLSVINPFSAPATP